MNFLHPRWNTDSMDNLLRKAQVSCEEFSVQQGIYMWKSYMGIGKHLIKRMTTWSAAVIYVHSLLIKKCVFRPIFYFFFIAAQQGTLNCSCLTSWLPLVCYWKKRKLNLQLVFSVMELIHMWKVWQGCLSPVKNAEVSVDKNNPHKRVLKWKQREEDVK